jgi:hypothetical protein
MSVFSSDGLEIEQGRMPKYIFAVIKLSYPIIGDSVLTCNLTCFLE